MIANTIIEYTYFFNDENSFDNIMSVIAKY